MSEALDLTAWVGRREISEDVAGSKPADILAATLDRDDPPYREGDPLPPAWHWLYFHEVVKLASTGADGHPARGGFLPPVPLPRRMWAGNRMRFLRALRVGERIRRVSTVERVEPKTGTSGALCIVTVRHEISGAAGVATIEEHDIVYREAPRRGTPTASPRPAPGAASVSRTLRPGPVLLFRFSALTMNSHRIHYDRPFCVEHEGYPGLLVHGPLTMILLLDLFRSTLPEARASAVQVRATAPLYDDGDIALQGRVEDEPGRATLWALTPAGALAMVASVSFE